MSHAALARCLRMAPTLDGGEIRFRPGQAEAVQRIKAAFDRGVKTVFLDAPVGSGKSLINLLVARDMLGAYVSTPQVILVNQYGADTQEGAKFSGLAATLYGRRNYPCTYVQTLPDEEGGRPFATAEHAPCTYLDGWPRDCPDFVSCPYYSAKRLAQAHTQTVTTLAYLLTGIRFGLGNPASGWTERPLLVVDEAHSLAEDLVRFFKAEIGPRTLPGFRRKWLESPADPRFRLLETLPPYFLRLQEVLRSLQTERQPNRRQRERIERVSAAARAAEDLHAKLSLGRTEWVHSFDSRRERHSWRPLSVGKLLGSFWDHFNHVLLSSATFFGLEELVRDAGLPAPYERVVVPDNFPPERAPIVLTSAARLGYRADALEVERAADAVAAIAKTHRLERGVIHANSYRLATAIRSYLPKEVLQRVTTHEPGNRVRRFDRWKSDQSSTAIFLAVAMNQGIDLMGDLARWQVLVKAPFPNLGDTWVRRRREQEDGEAWYASRTMIEILQASGRIMRAPEDRGTTYIVDARADELIEAGWRDLPEWFRLRVSEGRRVRRSIPGRFGDYGIRSKGL